MLNKLQVNFPSYKSNRDDLGPISEKSVKGLFAVWRAWRKFIFTRKNYHDGCTEHTGLPEDY